MLLIFNFLLEIVIKIIQCMNNISSSKDNFFFDGRHQKMTFILSGADFSCCFFFFFKISMFPFLPCYSVKAFLVTQRRALGI